MALLAEFKKWAPYFPTPIRKYWSLFVDTISGQAVLPDGLWRWNSQSEMPYPPAEGYMVPDTDAALYISQLTYNKIDLNGNDQTVLFENIEIGNVIQISEVGGGGNLTFEAVGNAVLIGPSNYLIDVSPLIGVPGGMALAMSTDLPPEADTVTTIYPGGLMNWRGGWVSRKYVRNDVVIDGDWLMIANKTTTDRPSPQPIGEVGWVLPDIPAFVTENYTGEVGSGLRVSNLTEVYSITKYRFWIPDVSYNATYRIIIKDNITGVIDVGEKVRGDILGSTGWVEVNLTPVWALPGDDSTIFVLSGNDSATTDFNYPWIYVGTSNQSNDPLPGNCNSNVQQLNVRINNTDDDGASRGAWLASIIPGTIIRIAEEVDLTSYYEYEVIGFTDMLGWFDFDVTLLSTGPGGQPGTSTRCQVYFQVPVAAPVDYVQIVDQYAGNSALSGQISFDGGPTTDNQNAYGIDIEVQRYTASEDWDLLSTGGGSGGGSGAGVDEFKSLLDTPVDYVGSKGQRVTVRADELGLEFLPKTGEYAEAQPTGLYDGGELNIGPGVEDIEVVSGAGIIIDSYTNPLDVPTSQVLSWNQINEAISVPSVAGSLVFLTMTDGGPGGPIAGTNLGVLVQRPQPPTQPQVRDEIVLGVAIYNGDTWGEISAPIVVNSAAHTLAEYVYNVFGPTYTISGGKVTEAAAFTLDREAGVSWERNRNWHINKKDPHREAFAASTPIQFRYVTSDFGSVSGLTSTIDPTNYENPLGTIAPVGGGVNTCTIQRLYIDPRDNIWVLWGQNIYDNFKEAVAQVSVDTANTVVPFILQKSQLLGYIISERTKADWADEEARFMTAVEVAGSGGGPPPEYFTDLIDTPANYVGAAGQSAVVNAGQSALEFIRNCKGNEAIGFSDAYPATTLPTGLPYGVSIIRVTTPNDYGIGAGGVYTFRGGVHGDRDTIQIAAGQDGSIINIRTYVNGWQEWISIIEQGGTDPLPPATEEFSAASTLVGLTWETVIDITSGGPYILERLMVDAIAGDTYYGLRITIDGIIVLNESGGIFTSIDFPDLFGPYSTHYPNVFFARTSFKIEAIRISGGVNRNLRASYQRYSVT